MAEVSGATRDVMRSPASDGRIHRLALQLMRDRR